MNITVTVLLSILTSLVATIIWVIFTKLYDFESRKNIDYLLEMAINCSRQFEYAIKYNEYQIALTQADRIIDLLKEIRENIRPFTFLSLKKKFILTLLYNSLYIIDIFKNLTVGYSGHQEEIARCERFDRKYLYNIQLDEEYSVPFLSFSLEIIQDLNRRLSVKKALSNNLSMRYCSNKKDILISMIFAITTKSESKYCKFDLRKDIFSYKEYEEYIDKKVSVEKPTNEQ
ncbi:MULTISPECIES: hypothetical protein [unclassified Sedimentibacter]|uniref:hypothetical protein n=1 Tax=unclassified Sedimentibacter TaxID=2649220 RepID=UPI0027E13EEF|nr:hypothetical protein [Sedimentibacter sp. MB35-C1]WMJ78859.1 hypothetical protein RBQ61_08000 [Sedimentibacter sp. MB35-C1]